MKNDDEHQKNQMEKMSNKLKASKLKTSKCNIHSIMIRLVLQMGLLLFSCPVFSQQVYQLHGDSIQVKSSTGNGEFILENSTKNINGFLYNRGNGRTEFRRALLKVNDSTYILGADTLLLKNQLRTTDNNLSILGSTIDTRKTPYTINYAASVVYDAQNGYNQRLVLSGNVTAFTFSHTQGGDYLALNVIQDATGGRTIIWPSAIKWKGGIAPTLTTTGNAVDKIMFYYNSDSGFYEGVYGLDFK